MQLDSTVVAVCQALDAILHELQVTSDKDARQQLVEDYHTLVKRLPFPFKSPSAYTEDKTLFDKVHEVLATDVLIDDKYLRSSNYVR